MKKKIKNIHFISSYPRSGSTLLANILAQNQKFHSTHTSGCLDVLFGIRNSWTRLIEHQAHEDSEGMMRVLRATLQAYHEDKNQSVIFDKSRGHLAHLEMLEEILQRPVKILVNVRSLPDILTSFEKLHRETAKHKQPPGEAENYFQFQTVAGRCAFWTRNDQVVGLALNRLNDAIQRGFKDRIHLVEFDKLTKNPKQTVRDIYDFLGEEYFEHDFNHVEQVTEEDDAVHGYINLHKIKNKVEPVKSQAIEILGEELVKAYTIQPQEDVK